LGNYHNAHFDGKEIAIPDIDVNDIEDRIQDEQETFSKHFLPDSG